MQGGFVDTLDEDKGVNGKSLFAAASGDGEVVLNLNPLEEAPLVVAFEIPCVTPF